MQRGEATLLSPTVAHCPLSSAQSDRGEYRTEDGLVKGHAYSVTGTHKVRNPQGGLARGVRAPNSPLTMPPLGVTGLHQGAAAAAAEPMGPSGVEWGLERQVGCIWGGWVVRLPPAPPLTPQSLQLPTLGCAPYRVARCLAGEKGGWRVLVSGAGSHVCLGEGYQATGIREGASPA